MRWTFDMMRSMKNCASSALALTLAIAGGLAAPMRSDATNHIMDCGRLTMKPQ